MDAKNKHYETNQSSNPDSSICEPLRYMQRLRDYYLALGYDNPYNWAAYSDVPFTKLEKPIAESKIGLITTAAPYKDGAGDQGPYAPYNAAAKFYKAYAGDTNKVDFLGISHVGYDRKYSTAEDINSFFPLQALKRAGAPTNRSQATTIRQDCSDLLNFVSDDGVDAVLLVPN